MVPLLKHRKVKRELTSIAQIPAPVICVINAHAQEDFLTHSRPWSWETETVEHDG